MICENEDAFRTLIQMATEKAPFKDIDKERGENLIGARRNSEDHAYSGGASLRVRSLCICQES